MFTYLLDDVRMFSKIALSASKFLVKRLAVYLPYPST